MTPAATPDDALRVPEARDDPFGRVAVWLVPLLFWLYYLTPLLLPSTSLDVARTLLLVLPGVAGMALLLLRRRAPVFVAFATGMLMLGGPGAIGAAFVAQQVVARRHGLTAVTGLAAGWIIAAKMISLTVGPNGGAEWSSAHTVEFAIATGGVAIATLIGFLMRSRAAESRSRSEVDEVRRIADEARLERARLAERARIAREMHDVLAHRLSLVAMHAGALAYRHDLDAATTREAAALIQRSAQQSLDELRLVLADLRGTGPGSGRGGDDVFDRGSEHGTERGLGSGLGPDSGRRPEPPQPTLDDLPALVADAREGQAVELAIDGVVGRVPTTVSRHAFRIVQESLTNARKHAPGTPVGVRIRIDDAATPRTLRLEIANPAADLALPSDDGSGLGLIGISERVAGLGGAFEAGHDEGLFVVRAALPLPSDAHTSEDNR